MIFMKVAALALILALNVQLSNGKCFENMFTRLARATRVVIVYLTNVQINCRINETSVLVLIKFIN